MDVQVRFARTEEERAAIYHLRYATYVEEMHLYAGQADHSRRQLVDTADAQAHQLYAEVDGQVVGTLRLHLGSDGPLPETLAKRFELERFVPQVPVEQVCFVGRFMVRRDMRGTAVPYRLIQESIRFQLERGMELTLCDCQPHLLNLYTSLGFRPYLGTYDDPEFGVMVPLVLVLRDREHLEWVGSPLRALLPSDAPASEVPARVAPLLEQARGVLSQEASDPDQYWREVHGLLGRSRPQVFSGLSEPELQAVLASSHVIECAPGDCLIRRGQVARTVFVVLSGTLEVRDGERVVAVVSEGEVLGEVAFLLSTPRISDVYATGAGARLLCLSEKSLRGLIDSSSRAAALLLLNLSRALAHKLVQRADSPK
ncbi:GNAT family N-acetyltransferase [Hyalangium rubrum]|uniref:Cyclic nucleotide-binding domain-containing protein n=1 Tax=Hyalangium rubrum TaxID=3103134 RepID=A0ABU5GY03_9BACT|nr:GNAT family N-acetyltransferase [Hyalangium sp. s54d21]MDY7226070.1 cyclic nucleotide-binding domain-containing protein [Hyalangium sp. s54d21]